MRAVVFLVAILLAPFAQAGMSISAGTAAHTHADANTGGASIACPAPCSTRACATGFTRRLSNYCSADAPLTSHTGLTRDVCTAIASPAGSSAAALVISVRTETNTANAVGIRTTQVTAFPNSSCTAGQEVAQWILSTREETATPTVLLGATTSDRIVPCSVGCFYLKFEDDAGNVGLGAYLIRGYFD